ncbi:MAG: flagellar biosynthesis protein FlhB [Candidatus Melainabacteria bacterium GWF2_37_15]|nr:MAG: flagellar biosynthesis protein FlhB [Candidatus Melainabacteria bacterium GWF2_37_15]
MADEDKPFEATAQKLRKVRKEGQVVKSKDLSTALSLLVMFLALNALAPLLWNQISKLFILLYEQIPNANLDKIGYTYVLFLAVFPTILIIVPILFLSCLVAIAGDFMQVGPLFATKSIEPKFDKLNPVSGFKNIFFSLKTYFELAKNVVKVIVLGLVAFFVFKAHIPALLSLCAMENTFAILYAFGQMIIDFVIKAGIIFLVIAGADYAFTRWKFLKDQKMSFKEIRDEYKNSEGDPHVKAALRQKRMQMLHKTMQDSVPDSDFVITNPTHIAVALKYDSEKMEAPRLLAKGTELFAKKIIQIAKEHNIPVIENPPVARAIFRFVEINREIPPELYKAVAEILLFVYNLRKDTKVNTNNA